MDSLNTFTSLADDNAALVDSIPKVLIHPEMNTDFVIEALKQAKEAIAFSALSVPTQEFAQEVVYARNRGVRVYILITNPFFEVGTNYAALSSKFETDIQTLKNMKDRLHRDVEFINILTDNNIYPRYLDRKYYINH